MVSPLGWGDALVGGYAVRLLEGDAPVECLRFGLGCAAANLIALRGRRVLAGGRGGAGDAVELEEVPAE